MSDYVFQPLLSFNARCHWQFAGDPLTDPDKLRSPGQQFKPLWVEFNDWNGDDGWLMSGRDYDPKEIQSFLRDGLPFIGPRQRIYCEYFWFGVYQIGELYAYEIRPAYAGANIDRWPELEYALDVSRGGYLGMYPNNARPGASTAQVSPSADVRLPDPVPTWHIDLPVDPLLDSRGLVVRVRRNLAASLWTLDGLDPTALSSGDTCTGIVLFAPSGRIVRRLIEGGRAYLNERTGRRGYLALQVLHSNVPPHPKFNRLSGED